MNSDFSHLPSDLDTPAIEDALNTLAQRSNDISQNIKTIYRFHGQKEDLRRNVDRRSGRDRRADADRAAGIERRRSSDRRQEPGKRLLELRFELMEVMRLHENLSSLVSGGQMMRSEEPSYIENLAGPYPEQQILI